MSPSLLAFHHQTDIISNRLCWSLSDPELKSINIDNYASQKKKYYEYLTTIRHYTKQ